MYTKSPQHYLLPRIKWIKVEVKQVLYQSSILSRKVVHIKLIKEIQQILVLHSGNGKPTQNKFYSRSRLYHKPFLWIHSESKYIRYYE